jgi:hypothetical protein
MVLGHDPVDGFLWGLGAYAAWGVLWFLGNVVAAFLPVPAVEGDRARLRDVDTDADAVDVD